MEISVRELLRVDGISPFGDWFNQLDPIAAAKISTAIIRMGQGNLSNVKWFEGIGEFRLDWGPGYRIYLARDGVSLILLLGGGTKQRQQNDIRRAISLGNEYKQTKRKLKQK